jgi:hypothetical protein
MTFVPVDVQSAQASVVDVIADGLKASFQPALLFWIKSSAKRAFACLGSRGDERRDTCDAVEELRISFDPWIGGQPT